MFILGMVGLGEVYMVLSYRNIIFNELIALFKGNKSLMQLSSETSLTLIVMAIFISSLTLYLLGKYLYWKWFCKDIKMRYGNS